MNYSLLATNVLVFVLFQGMSMEEKFAFARSANTAGSSTIPISDSYGAYKLDQ